MIDKILIKEQIKKLNLKKYYSEFKKDDNSSNFYSVIYMYIIDDKYIYIGNRQYPLSDDPEYTAEKYTIANYWLYGDSDDYIILYTFQGISNGCIDVTKHGECYNKLANQPVFNRIKQEISNTLNNANMNIQQVPDGMKAEERIAVNIKNWKTDITKQLERYNVTDFKNDMIAVCEMLSKFPGKEGWWRELVIHNRYYFIKNKTNPELDRLGFYKLTKQQMCVFIVMKDWLTRSVNEEILRPYYKLTIKNVIYKLQNSRWSDQDYFGKIQKRDYFKNVNCIKFMLAAMYSKVDEIKYIQISQQFFNWRNKYLEVAFNK
jgi:hypothetical protein